VDVKRIVLWSGVVVSLLVLVLAAFDDTKSPETITSAARLATMSCGTSGRTAMAQPLTLPASMPESAFAPSVRAPSSETASFARCCRRAERVAGGKWSVALWHEQGKYYYPDRATASQATWAASVIKLQIVTSYLLADILVHDTSLCSRAISQSDNEAANQLMDAAGAAAVNRFCESQGYVSTHLVRHFGDPADLTPGYNQTSVVDQVRFLRDLWEGRVLPPEGRLQLLDWMHHQARRTKIPRYLGDYETYSKTGELWDPPVQNDVAIVCRGDDVWYLAIFVSDSPRPDSEVRQAIGVLAKQLVTLPLDTHPDAF